MIRYGDVHVGTIRMRAGVPGGVDQWGWTIGFYPASHRGVRADGTAESFDSFDQARADFEAAWSRLLPRITQADFDEHRRYCTREAWKHAMWDKGCKLPTQVAGGRSRCYCGADIGIADVERHVVTAHMEHVGF